MKYAWVIYYGHFVTGPADMDLTIFEILDHPLRQHFRLLDADGYVYYSGVFVPLSDDHTGFEPLDDYGRPNDGCTEIQYRRDGQWKTL